MIKEMKVSEKNKSQYWQMVRGICILAVIMIHCPNAIGLSTGEFSIWMIIRQLINFPVALFIFMAGYFVNIDKVEKNSCAYLLNRGGRLLVPYFVWSILYLVKDYVLSGGNVSIRQIIYSLCFGKATAPLYYIVVMIQLTMLTPWLVKFKNRGWLYAVTPFYLVLLYVFNVITGEMPRLYETFFPAWFLFYILGMDCRNGKLDNVISMIKKRYFIIAFAISVIEAGILLKAGCSAGFASSQIKFSSFIYTAVIALVLMKTKDNAKQENGRIQRLLSSIGDCSYGIFYVHMLVLLIVKKVVTLAGLPQIWILNFLFCFVLTACGSYALVLGVKKLAERIGAEKCLKIIGF